MSDLVMALTPIGAVEVLGPASACTLLLDLMSRHMLSYMPKTTCNKFHLAVLCDSLRCGAYGIFCYGIS